VGSDQFHSLKTAGTTGVISSTCWC
jgi:hypothetical protein